MRWNQMNSVFPIILLCLLSAASWGKQNRCSQVEIADMNWNSATFIAHVDQFILEHGYGCHARLVPATTQVTGLSILQTGKPDIIPEFWGNSMREAVKDAITQKALTDAGTPFAEGATEGFWIPSYMAETTPEIANITGLIKNASLFSQNNKADPVPFYGCPKGWNCQISSRNLFIALQLGQANFKYVTPSSSAELAASLQRAYEAKAPWFGYYWSPTALFGKYKMTQVDFGTGVDKEEFERCISKDGCTNPTITMYPTPLVQTLVTADFSKREPKAYKYLSTRGWSDKQMNEMLAWMSENQADGDAAMLHFLKNYQAIWVKWVDGNAVRSVRKALEEL